MVRDLLGHTDAEMTLRYAHLAPQVKADAVAKLDLLWTNDSAAKVIPFAPTEAVSAQF